MVREARRTVFTGSPLVRSLAPLADIDVAASKQAFVEGLARWLAWTDAIALSAALGSAPGTAAGAPPSASAEEREVARVRAALATAIAEDAAGTADRRRAHRTARAHAEPADPSADFAPYRRRCQARQQAMEASIGALRRRLRDALAATSGPLAKLAAVDAVLEQVLGAQERTLLSIVPQWLEKRFERLRQAHLEALAETQAPDDPARWGQPGGWLDAFRRELHGVLLAELDIRLQPVDGLLQALRTRPPGHHD